MNYKLLKNIIYNSGDVFLPDNIKEILSYNLIGSHKKTFYISGWSIVHFINGIIFGYLYLYSCQSHRPHFLFSTYGLPNG